MKKILDLEQSFVKLQEKITEFQESNTTNGMERVEIEGVIQQVNRLIDKLDKFMKIVGRKFNH